MSDQTTPETQTDSPLRFAESVANILEANGLGEKMMLMPTTVVECAKDANENRLLQAEVGTRRFYVTLSPALKGRLVGEDRVEDEEVRQHFDVNIIGETLKK